MAGFTTAAIIGGATALGGSVIGAIEANKARKEGRRMRAQGEEGIKNFEWQDLDNALPIHLEGINMLREENARMSATAMDAIRSGGTRGLGVLTDLIGHGNKLNQEIRASIDDQYMKRDQMKAAMIEQRQAQELAGYGQLMNVGSQMYAQGNNDFFNSIMSGSFGAMLPLIYGLSGNKSDDPNDPNIGNLDSGADGGGGGDGEIGN